MRKRAGRSSRTVPSSSHFIVKIKNYFSTVALFIIDALIKTGSLILWPIKAFYKISVTSKQFLDFKDQFLNNLKAKEKRIITSANSFFLNLKATTKKRKKIPPAIKKWQQLLQKKSNYLAKKIKTLKLAIKRKISTFKKPSQFRKKAVIYRSKLYYFEKVKFIIVGVGLTIFLLVIPLIMFFWLSELPNPRLLSSREIPLTTKIYDRNGTLLYQIYDNQNRSFVSLNLLPKNLINATIAIEDKNFYHHKGVDLKGILRAVLVNVSSTNNHNGRPLQGGSSITQQLIKNALLTSEPTISRKVKEVALAIWAELIYSKDEILEMYFNQVPYGGTAWGVEAAAETYFKKKAIDLDLAESSLLAGLPAAPTLYSPFGAHPELAKERQQAVLRRMLEDRYITSEEADKAKAEELHFASPQVEIKAPHFVMYVKDLLVKKYGLRTVEQGGLNVVTTLDLNIHEMAQEEVSREVENLKGLLVGNGAALVINPKTGEILAMVGSRDYFDLARDGNVNVTIALRQPGSSIKPVMYAAALQHGYTPSSIIDDSPISFQVAGQPGYTPVNYDGKFHGKVTLRSALANSYNVPAVKVLNSIGVHTMIEMGKKMGITTWKDENRYGLSLTLGGGDVTMLDMATAFGVLADNGQRHDLQAVLKTTDYKGNILEEAKFKDGKQVIPSEIAFQLSNILSENNARSAAFGFNSALNIAGKSVSVKTGTTNEKRDNWTIGYTPSILTAVWVGNNDNSPMHPYLTSGITGAAPIWHNIMVNLLKNKADEPISKASDLVEVQVCSWNGLLPCEGCPTITEYFVQGTEPKLHCQISPTPSPTPEKTL